MKRSLALVATLLAAAACARAGSNIVAGHHQLLPDLAGQEISILVSGDDQVSGFELYLMLTGGSPGPAFEAADCYSGAVFEGHEGGYYATSSFVQPLLLAQYGVTEPSDADEVTADGLLATVDVSTVGVAPGTYELLLAFEYEGAQVASNFAGVQPTLTPGSIEVLPEPAALALLGVGGILLMRRKRRPTPRSAGPADRPRPCRRAGAR